MIVDILVVYSSAHECNHIRGTIVHIKRHLVALLEQRSMLTLLEMTSSQVNMYLSAEAALEVQMSVYMSVHP